MGAGGRLGWIAEQNPVLRYNPCIEDAMGAIEDTSKRLQDFLAPELRELTARVDALEPRLDARFDAAERLASELHGRTMQAMGRLADVYELRERITGIEARERAS